MLTYERSGWDYATWIVTGLFALGVAVLCGFNSYYWYKIREEDTSKEVSSTTANVLFIFNLIFAIVGGVVVIWIVIIFIYNPKGKLVDGKAAEQKKCK